MVNEITFLGFKGAIAPNASPGSAPGVSGVNPEPFTVGVGL